MKKLGSLALVLAAGVALSGACSKDDDNPSGTGGATSGGAAQSGAANQAGAAAGGATSGGATNQAGAPTGPTTSGGATSGGATGGGAMGGTGVVFPPGCALYGDPCTNPSECCSAVCENNTCGSTVSRCAGPGATCGADTDCCNLNCVSSKCSATACTADGAACTGSAQCCSGTCAGGQCTALNPSCKTAGNPCTAATAATCCSGLCQGGLCARAASFCVQNGDICRADQECCSADCTLGANGVGTCAPIDIGSANCKGLEGMRCDDCNDCCSRVCGPYGPTGIKVCQPARGCRVMGDLCRTTNDCCGSAGTGLPGAGNVVCLKNAPNDAIGICRSPTGCSPQGNVCHYKEYVCGSSASRNNCCGATGESAKCELRNGKLMCGGTGFECQPGQAAGEACESCLLDPFQVPRCNGLGQCRATGETCSSAADCCNNLACVPDDKGVLRCGATVCIERLGACTVDADCCRGLTCLRPLGSTRGTCDTPPPPPPPTGGAPGTGGTSSVGGTSAGGTGGTVSCSLFGQQCSTGADCCNADLLCIGGICLVPPG